MHPTATGRKEKRLALHAWLPRCTRKERGLVEAVACFPATSQFDLGYGVWLAFRDSVNCSRWSAYGGWQSPICMASTKVEMGIMTVGEDGGSDSWATLPWSILFVHFMFEGVT